MKRTLTNLWNNKYIYFSMMIIFLIVLIFSSFMYKNVSNVNKYNNFIKSYFMIPDMYMLTVTNSIEDDPYVEKLTVEQEGGGRLDFATQVLREAIKQGKSQFGVTRTGVHETRPIEIRETKGDKRYYLTEPSQPFQQVYPNLGLYLNDLFGENIRFPIVRGRNFKTSDFRNTGFLSVIAGYDYMKDFKIGDNLNIKVTNYYAGNEIDTTVPARTIGFLSKDTEVMTYICAPDIIKADKLLILGVSKNYKYEYGFEHMFDETLEGVVETKNPIQVEDKLFGLARTMGYEGKGNILKLYKMNEAFQDDVRFNDRSFSSFYKILAASLTVSFVITSISVYLVIRKNKYDYGVLLTCRATRGEIRRAIFLEMFVVVLAAELLGLTLSIKYMGKPSLPVFLVYDASILLIVMATSILVLKNKKTIDFVNRNEQ